MAKPSVFSMAVKAPPEFYDFINGLVTHVKLDGKEAPPVTDEHIALYIRAFISPSLKTVVGKDIDTNKQYEFLGDAALQLSATQWLRLNFPNDDVARLTSRRQCLVSNKTGLTSLAEYLEVHKFLNGQFDRGGNKLLPNVVEAIIGVMQELHGFEYVHAFLVPLFDSYAGTWFELYLPESIKIAISKSNINLNGFYSQITDSTTKSYRNELEEYISSTNKTHLHANYSKPEYYFEQVGENKNIYWSACVRVNINHDFTLESFAQCGTKKAAQNEACCLLLRDIQKYNAQTNDSIINCKDHNDSEQNITTKSLIQSVETVQQPICNYATVSSMFPTTNFKSVLITLYQRSGGILDFPEYSTIKEGPDHAPRYTTHVTTGGTKGVGMGLRINDAEQKAAKDAISRICGISIP